MANGNGERTLTWPSLLAVLVPTQIATVAAMWAMVGALFSQHLEQPHKDSVTQQEFSRALEGINKRLDDIRIINQKVDR